MTLGRQTEEMNLLGYWPWHSRLSKGANRPVEHRNTIVARLLPKLYVTDPRSDKRRLVDDKGELFRNSFSWLLQDSSFKKWRDGQDASLLWLKGTAGKGKTMMCIGIIDELLLHLKDDSAQLNPVFFFCQSQYSNLNNPVSVLKGIIWLMIEQRPSLIEHLAQRIASKGPHIFEGPNSVHELWALFEDILYTPTDGTMYVVVDALDECDQGRLDVLLKGILGSVNRQPQKVKWLLTSRPSPEIEHWLRSEVDRVITISLDDNRAEVSEAVAGYIKSRVGTLATTKHYDDQLRQEIVSSLHQKAEGTFLWVSLVCKRLETVPRSNVRAAIAQFPKGLIPLFERMLHLLLQDEDEQQVEFCISIVRSAVLAWSPIHIKEVGHIAGLSREVSDDEESLRELIDRCGSFLEVNEGIVSFIHQSAREYLSASQRHGLLSLKLEEEHLNIAIRCLNIMSDTLHDNMGALEPGSDLSDIRIDLVNDMVARCGYSTHYWMKHIGRANGNDAVNFLARIERFLRVCFLRWCEILCLTAQLPVGRRALEDLVKLVRVHPVNRRDQVAAEFNKRAEATTEGVETALCDLVIDAVQFYTTYTPVFSQWPLQIYCAALAFSPESNQIKRQFQTRHLKWFSVRPRREDNYGSKLQVLEGHSQAVSAVTFSPDGKLIASGSLDKTIRIWNADVGTFSKTLTGHSLGVTSIAFSPDSKHVASASDDTMIKIWAVASGDVLHTLSGHSCGVGSVSFSRVSDLLASTSHDGTIRLWKATAGASSGIISSQCDRFTSIALSADGKSIATITARDRCVKLWRTETLSLEGITTDHEMEVTAVAFSPDSAIFASGSKDKTIRIWDSATRNLKLTLASHTRPVTALEISPDGLSIATGSIDRTVKLWELASGCLLAVFKGHMDRISSVSFSPDGKVIASASRDNSVILWNATGKMMTEDIGKNSWNSSAVALSPDCRFAASAFGHPEVTLWDVATGQELHRFKTKRPIWEVSFSDDQAYIQINQGSYSIEHFTDRRSFSQCEAAAEVDIQDQWIIWRKQKVIWLPREYRSTVFAARKSTVVLACPSGRVVIVGFVTRVANALSGVFG
jgi:WD40 repeat protein